MALNRYRTSAHIRWPRYLVAALLAIYVLTFVRGLSWQWRGIITANRASVPVVQNAPRSGAGQAAPPQPVSGAPPANAPANTGPRKVPLQRTDDPPPRNATDQYGVYYDDQGVAVMGIDGDPSGVYNVPPGRQIRIGGPAGALFDVTDGGQIVPATAVRQQAR